MGGKRVSTVPGGSGEYEHGLGYRCRCLGHRPQSGSAYGAKRSLLSNRLSYPVFETLQSLVAPRKLRDVPLSVVVDTLQAQYGPKQSEVSTRFRFEQRKQQPGEAPSAYMAALRGLAVDCHFENDAGRILENRHRDHFVFGLNNGEL